MSTVVDLCCGTGTQGLMVARHARGVIGIELSKSAVEDARSTKDSPIGIVFSVSLATSNKKRIGNRWIHFNSTSPCEPSEKKRARKHAHVNSPLLAVNQYESGRHETDWTRRPRRFSSFLRTSSKFSYTPDGGDTSKDLLEEIHKQIQNCVSKPAPRLSELVTSSIG
jgi:hypothetical protein